MTWKVILALIWDKFFGASDRTKEFKQISKGWRDLYEEQRRIVSDYENQLKSIDKYKEKHPENGIEFDEWRRREKDLMNQLIAAKQECYFYKERCIFLEHENDLLLREKEKPGENTGL